MTDSPEKKTILNAVHNLLQETLHLVLVPVVAGLKGIIAGLQYLHDELAKY